MAAAATATASSAAALGARAAVSPLLRRGRGRRRRPRGAREEKREEAEAGGGPGCCCACPPGPGRPLCRSSRPDSLGRRQQQPPPPVRPASGGEPPPPPPPPPPDRDFVFRAPITLSKPGELHEEYRSQLRKLRDEKLQEERTPEDFIHKLVFEDPEAGRRKGEDQKKEEPSAVKMTQEHLPERLSDSENEEPFQGKSGHHRSAFVSKGSSYSLALLAGNLGSRVERSQSCNDTLQERSKRRQRSAPVRTKVNPLASACTPVAGVLSSTQNNRCLSAPDLTAEKRVGLGAAASSLSALPKPERSISPESNDSISEELNHFKPIVCSPCTPPKRLPDGRVLSPHLIKSTPRNLTRSLQKPTTYEASPRILRKWEQIFQERQIKKTLSKATLTSSGPDAGEDFLVPSVNVIKEPPQASKDFPVPGSLGHAQAELDSFPSLCGAKLERSGGVKRDSEAAGDGPAAPMGGAVEPLRHPKAPNASNLNSASCTAGSGTKPGARRASRVRVACPENGALGGPAQGKKKQPRRLKYLNESERGNLLNGACCGEEPPSLRRGRKRWCKTKHVEHSCAAKRPRQGGAGVGEPLRRSRAEQRRQEAEDRRLALQLQGAFDRENRRGARWKGRAEQYFLRSKSTGGAQ